MDTLAGYSNAMPMKPRPNPMGYSTVQSPGANDIGRPMAPRPAVASPQNTSMQNMPRPMMAQPPAPHPMMQQHPNITQAIPGSQIPRQQYPSQPQLQGGYNNVAMQGQQMQRPAQQQAPQQFQPQAPAGQPMINAGPVYNAEQQSQLINQAIGQNAMQQGTANQQAINHLNAGGFAGAGSPKAMALQNQNAAARMMADTNARTSIPLQLADKNAQHLLDAQRAQEQQYANRQNERLTGQGQQFGFMGNLLNSLLV